MDLHRRKTHLSTTEDESDLVHLSSSDNFYTAVTNKCRQKKTNLWEANESHHAVEKRVEI